MDERILKPFVQSTADVFERSAKMILEKRKVAAMPPDVRRLKVEVAAILGLTGKLRGQMVLISTEEIVKKFTSVAFMMGEPVTEFNEIVESCAGEILNLIAGDCSPALLELGYSFEITPPSVLHGNTELSFPGNMPIFLIEFGCDRGPVTIALCLEIAKPAA